MAKLYDPLLVPEWRIATSPKGFADGVLKSLRTITDRMRAMVQLTPARKRVRPYYHVYTVKVKDILYQNSKFTITLPVAEIDFFGNGLTGDIAIRGRDFTAHDTSYTFTQHPSKYGTVAVHGTDTVLELIGTGGDYNWDEAPEANAYHGNTDTVVVDAINSSLYSNAPMAMSVHLLEAVGGCRLSGDPLQITWVEDNLQLGITTKGELVYAPVNSGITFIAGSAPNTNEILGKFDMFTVNVDGVTYVVMLGENQVTDYPGIITKWPNLQKGDVFYGAELLSELLDRGCVFYWWTYINNDKGQQETLSQYLMNPGKVQIGVRAKVTTKLPLGAVTTQAGKPSNKSIVTKGRGYNFS